MNKNYKKKIILFFLFSPFLLIACLRNPSVNINITNTNAKQDELTPEELEQKYESEISEILQPVWQNKDFTGVKEKILALKAPAKYLDLHLNLVIAFELIEQGQMDSDQDKIEEGIEKLEKLKTQYPWLAQKI